MFRSRKRRVGEVSFAAKFSDATFSPTVSPGNFFPPYVFHYKLTQLNKRLQFQLLLCYTSLERIEIVARQRALSKAPLKPFAKKLIDSALRPLAEIFADFMKDISVEKIGRNNLASKVDVMTKEDLIEAFEVNTTLSFDDNAPMGNSLMGEVTISALTRPEDPYASVQNKGMHAMHLRLEHLFDQVDNYFGTSPAYGGSAREQDSLDITSTKLASKPVVIGDALPLPVGCPESVEQLLEAALAHHNLGSYDEALKFLEASRVQLLHVEKHIMDVKHKVNGNLSGTYIGTVELPLDMYMYISICKGNVYQSCGDDENSLLVYFEALSKANAAKDVDWEMVCINNIGMLAYYNMKYETALRCFTRVVTFREEVCKDRKRFVFFRVTVIFNYQTPNADVWRTKC